MLPSLYFSSSGVLVGLSAAEIPVQHGHASIPVNESITGQQQHSHSAVAKGYNQKICHASQWDEIQQDICSGKSVARATQGK